MKTNKTVTTKYQLNQVEVLIAIRNYIIQTKHLSENVLSNGIELQPILGEQTELIGAELTFTKETLNEF